MKKTIINLLSYYLSLLILFINFLDGQITGSLANTGIFLKNLQFDFSPVDEKNGTKYYIEIDEFNFGFSDIFIDQRQNSKAQLISTKISGPNLNLNGFKLGARVFIKDWVTTEKIKRLEKRLSIPRKAINLIADAVDIYKLDMTEYPNSLNDLYIKNYLDLDREPFKNQTWTYSLLLPREIIAHPTHINPIPTTQPFVFDWHSRTFQLEPAHDSLYNISETFWDYALNIREISQKNSSKIEIIKYPDKTNFDFILDQGQFKIENISVTANPENDLNNHTRINLANLVLEVRKVAFLGNLSSLPKVKHGEGKFTIRNFEIKIPDGLKDEPEIQSMLETLGIWNNELKVRLIELSINLMNEYTGDIKFVLATPFLKINIDGDYSLRQDKIHPEILLHKMVVKIHPISLGVRKWIRNWEIGQGKTLNRQGATIILKLDGPLKNPVIHGY